jgi:hypothetical protein
MEESYQSKASLPTMSEGEIVSALQAGLSRDRNTLRALAAIQVNNLSNAYSNIRVILGAIDPKVLLEYDSIVTFASSDVVHLVDSTFGNERDISLDPVEEDLDNKQV